MNRIGTLSLTPEDAAELRDRMLVIPELLSGAFDSRIKELKKLNAEIKERQEAITSIPEAKRVRAEAEAYAKSVREDAEKIAGKAQADLDKATELSASLMAREKNITENQKALDAASAKYEAEKRESAEKLRVANDSLAARDRANGEQADRLKAEWEKLQAEKMELAKQRDAFNAKLKSLAA